MPTTPTIVPDNVARVPADPVPLDLAVLGQDPRFGGGGSVPDRGVPRGGGAARPDAGAPLRAAPRARRGRADVAPGRGAAAAARGIAARRRGAGGALALGRRHPRAGRRRRAARRAAVRLLARDDDRLGVAGPGAGPAGRAQRSPAARASASLRRLERRRAPRRHAALRDEPGEPRVGRGSPPASTADAVAAPADPDRLERFTPEPDEAWLARLDVADRRLRRPRRRPAQERPPAARRLRARPRAAAGRRGCG